ncbi:Golgi-associated plant pathogenesis-related protein 1-like [Scaptodrosophila lebanonensis]|uniref:Golgi-associated plant pathogenesis-related protein 1-like n=1 Tax=Drosophila lebanonensis TaxID=7225 RepID=A0A6J2TDV2_DROLE|nr:Golgi-associated plant pathogenesis-related protein 1-like [Scaptodrosophila lebanonensis]
MQKLFCVVILLLYLPAIWANLEDDILAAHNDLRVLHKVAPLRLNSQMSKEAAAHAKILAEKEDLIHSDSTAYGENLCYTTFPPTTCVKSWYDEINKFDFAKPELSKSTTHFTQIIWKTTTDLGVGSAKSADGMDYVVVRYKPPGNIDGQLQENVVPRFLKRGGNRRTKSENVWILIIPLLLVVLSKLL